MEASPCEIEEVIERFEGGLEFREESEEESSVEEDCGPRSGPWVEKGNPTGFLDSEDEEMFDQWENEETEKLWKGMTGED